MKAKTRLCRILLACLAGCCPNSAFGADYISAFAHHSWRTQDGLPDQVVQAIAQTPDHYLWIGTTKGLLRFDGRTFFPISQPALGHGVTCLTVSKDGSLYIGTEGGGLVRFTHGIWEHLSERSGIVNGLVRTVLQTSDGTVLVGTDHGIYTSAENKFTRLPLTARFPELGSASIVQDRTGAIWSGGSLLVRFRGSQAQTFQLPDQNGSMRIKALCVGPDGSIWVGAVAGLFHQTVTGTFEKVREVVGSVRTLSVAGDGRVWVGTAGNGLFIQSGAYFEHLQVPSVLPSNTVLCQYADLAGNIWLGTEAGLLRLSRMGMRLVSLQNAPESDFGTVTRDRDGSLWICSSQLFHLENGRAVVVRFPGLQGVVVRTLFRDSTGALWLGTSGRGAYRFKGRHLLAHYTSDIGTNYIRGFWESSDGSIWIATDGGIARYHEGHVDNLHELPDAPRNLVLSVEESRDQTLWVGTQRGLWMLRDGHFAKSKVQDQLGDQAIWAIHEGPGGQLWLGTDSGLYQLNGQNLIHVFFEADATNSAVYAILHTSDGYDWIAGPTRVYRTDDASMNSAVLSTVHELSSPAIYPVSSEIQGAELYGGMKSAGVLEPDGSAWFATTEGPLHLVPSEHGETTAAPLALEGVLLDGQPAKSTTNIDIPAGTKTLRVDFAPILPGSQADIRFQYMMVGFDRWSTPSKLRSAFYTNLPSGHYVLKIRALSANGRTISDFAIPVVQRSFFYTTWQFYVGCAMLLIAVIWAAYRFRVRRMQREFRAVAGERNRLAREMHDTVIQGCTAISALLEAHFSMESERSLLLESARDHIRSTIEEARDAIWNLRNEGSTPDLALHLKKLLEKCGRSSDAAMTFGSRGGSPEVDAMVAHEVLMSTREALTNAVAHSNARHIDLFLDSSERAIIVQVKDDGLGFDPATAAGEKDGHYGLKGICERIEGVGGNVSLDSQPKNGTRLRMTVPLVKPSVRQL